MRLLESCKLYKQISDNMLTIKHSKQRYKYVESLYYLHKLKSSKHWNVDKHNYLKSVFPDDIELNTTQIKLKLQILLKNDYKSFRLQKTILKYLERDFK